MDLFQMVFVGPSRAAGEVAAALTAAGWPARVDDDGPGNTGVDPADPAYVAELVAAGRNPDVAVVEAISAVEEDLGDGSPVVGVVARFGWWLRLHGWVRAGDQLQSSHAAAAGVAAPSLLEQVALMSPGERAALAALIGGGR